jgi:hypothetical protein
VKLKKLYGDVVVRRLFLSILLIHLTVSNM